MIGRIWHGWTNLENADKYEKLLKEEIFPGIAAKGVSGYKEIQLFRRPTAHPPGAPMGRAMWSALGARRRPARVSPIPRARATAPVTDYSIPSQRPMP